MSQERGGQVGIQRLRTLDSCHKPVKRDEVEAVGLGVVFLLIFISCLFDELNGLLAEVAVRHDGLV